MQVYPIQFKNRNAYLFIYLFINYYFLLLLLLFYFGHQTLYGVFQPDSARPDAACHTTQFLANNNDVQIFPGCPCLHVHQSNTFRTSWTEMVEVQSTPCKRVFRVLNPVSGGSYTCRVSGSRAVSASASDAFQHAAEASVSVDRVEARLTLMEAANNKLRFPQQPAWAAGGQTYQDNRQLNQQVGQLMKGSHQFNQQVEQLPQVNNQLSQQVGQLMKGSNQFGQQVGQLSQVNNQLSQQVGQLTKGSHLLNRQVDQLTLVNSRIKHF